MSLFKDIQLALDSRLKAANLGLDIAWENTTYKPNPGRAWLRPTVLNARSSMIDLEYAQDNPGIYQVDAFYPINKGTGDLLETIDNLMEHFFAQPNIIFGSQTIRIRAISKRPSLVDDVWFRGSLEIGFNCYST